MLRSLPARLICPTCTSRRSTLTAHEFLGGDDDHIGAGILRCDCCGICYPIENDVLELVPLELAYADRIADFCSRFAAHLAPLGYGDNVRQLFGTEQAHAESDHAEKLKQRKHFDNYAEQSQPDLVDYPRSPFWRAASSRFLKLWRSALGKPGSWILDVGCGTAVHSIPLADQHTIIGLDISKKAVCRATEEARRSGLMGATTFFVGDAAALPFKDLSFDYAQTIGALHHVPNPERAIRDIFRVLASGGIYYGVENNDTMFRWIFDVMMKVKPLWIEEAGSVPLMSRRMIETWAAGLNARVTSETSVFLPPHLFNFLEPRSATALLEASDRLCSAIPGLRHHGGQILFQMHKLS